MGLGLPLVFVSFPIFPFIFFDTEEEKTIELISPWLLLLLLLPPPSGAYLQDS